MSNTVKIGTIFLACLLNLFQAAALKESIPSTNPRLEKIKWDNSLTLPDLDGKPNIGVAGAFSGFIDNHLIIAGGANFPYATPWNGGNKTYQNTIYCINTIQPASKWLVLPESMPKALAYGNSIELHTGILCIGGCDSIQCYNDVFQIQLIDGQIKIDTEWPSLPVPLANATASLLGDKIYVAGGQKSMEKPEATNYFFVLDLNSRNKGWKELPSWPGEPRGYAVSTTQSDGFDKCFYLFSGRNYKADGYINTLTDGYAFNPRLNSWKKLKQSFPVMAGNALSCGANHILFLGGVPQLIPGSDDHPGFDNTIRLYHTITQSLIKKEVAPYPISVTTNIAQKGNTFYVGSGEVKPGIRTPHVLKGEIIHSKKNWV